MDAAGMVHERWQPSFVVRPGHVRCGESRLRQQMAVAGEAREDGVDVVLRVVGVR